MAAAGFSSAAAPVYFPLAAGNRWVYREATTGETFTIEAGIPIMHNDRVYHKLTGYGSGPHYATLNEFGNLFGLDLDSEIEYVITGFETTDAWWETHLSNCLQMAQPQKELREYQTPAGTTLAALELRYRSLSCVDTGILSELYAENIGLIERTVTTIAGPRTYSLVHARIGAVTYEIEPSTGLRVVLDRTYIQNYDVTKNERLKVTMRVSVRRAPPVVLQFGSLQRYDIRLRDDSGNVVYQWSEEVALPDTGSEVVVARDTDFVQEIPLHERDGFPLKGGYYTVEAWLNTTNREFAGAARVFVSPAE